MDQNNLILKKIPIPYYFQVKEKILERIKKNEFPLGSYLPSEKELSIFYDVSLVTLRMALDKLSESGYIEKIKGKGSKVISVDSKDKVLINRILSVSDSFKATSFKILESTKANKNSKALRELGLTKEDKYINIKKVKYKDKVTFFYSNVYLNEKLFPDFSKIDLNKIRIRKMIYDHVNINSVDITFYAFNASVKIAEIFKVKKGLALQVLEYKTFLNNGTNIEYSINYFRSDLILFEFLIQEQLKLGFGGNK